MEQAIVFPIRYGNFGQNGYAAAAAAVAARTAASFVGNIQSEMAGWHTQTGNCNYSYEGLNVTTKSLSGEPSVGRTSNSTEKMIPANYINGTYVGSAYANYTNH